MKSLLLGGILLAGLLNLPASAELIAVWKFDGDATDSTGHGHDGELIDAGFSDDTPDVLPGQSLRPDGGYIEVPHSEELNITTAITLSCFVKPEENAWEGIVAKNPSDGSNDNHAGNYELRIENGGRHLHFLHQQGADNDTAFHQGISAVVESGVWSHVAITADVESGDVNFYINGELIETLEAIIAVDEFPVNENPLYIGSRADLFTGFDGLMDELSLWNEALDADQIALLATGPASLEGAPDTDGDGIPDFYEDRFAFLNPADAADGGADQDGDGLSNAAEYAAGSNLEIDDTDGDGLKDGVETNTGVFASASDTGTDPRRADTDGDGLSDGVETNSGTFVDANDPGTSPVSTDSDEDMFGDNVELALGTNPLDAADRPDAVIAVADGVWSDGATWSDGQVPSAGKRYVALGSVTETLTSAAGDFGGDALTLIGPGITLELNHAGDATANIALNNAGIRLSRGARLGGKMDLRGSVFFEVGNNQFALSSQLSGDGSLTIQGGEPGDILGDVELTGAGSSLTGPIAVLGTNLAGIAPGSLGSGSLLTDSGIAFGYNYASPAAVLRIRGGDFRLVLGGEITMADLVGVDGDGGVLFSLRDLAGAGPFAASDLLEAFGLDTGISGAGSLTLSGTDGDTDGDGLLDSWETKNFGNLDANGEGDADGDGLNNLAEQSAGTDPQNADSDGDGLGDFEEIEILGTDPNAIDTDGDGLSDAVETATGVYVSSEDTGTDPRLADTDRDGLLDNVENNSGTFVSAADPGTDPNKADTDGDGSPDGVEINAGTNPLDPNDASALPVGTVGLWTFDADLPVQPDASGNGNDAQVLGAAWFNDPERGGVIEISDEGYLEVADSDSLDITTGITIAAWVRPVGEIDWDGILAKNPSDDSGPNHAGNYELRIENGGRFLHFLHQQGGANDTAFHQGLDSIIPADVWTHIAVTADTDSGDVTFYINGELSETLEGVVAVDEFPTNANPLLIGSRADLFTPMNGFLDDVILLDRAVAADEVAGILAGGFAGENGNGGEPPKENFAISNVRIGAGGNIRVDVSSAPDQIYVAEFSTDLINWIVTVDDVASDGALTIIRQPLPEAPAGYIRVRVK